MHVHFICLGHTSNTDAAPRCDSMPTMKGAIGRLRDRLGSEPEYFQKVYNHTFDFARSPGQRSLRMSTPFSLALAILIHVSIQLPKLLRHFGELLSRMDYTVARWRISTQRTTMTMTTWGKEGAGKRNMCNGGLTFWPRRAAKVSARIRGLWSVAFFQWPYLSWSHETS
jgi:predicted lipoprotein with Yx(FWY)xxD motif